MRLHKLNVCIRSKDIKPLHRFFTAWYMAWHSANLQPIA